MKNLIGYLLHFLAFFILFSAIVNSGYLAIIMATDWDFSKRIETLRFDDPDFDLLILGSSLALYGIDSEQLTRKGIKSYNMALVGNTVKTCYVQLEEYLTKYSTKPKYVILATNECLERFSQEGIHPVVEFSMKNQKIDFKDIPLSKFRWQGTELFKKAFSKEYRSGYVSLGQIKRYKIVPDDTKVNNRELDLEKYKRARWIGKLAELCLKENIELFIVEIPGVNETRNSDVVGPHKISFENGCQSTLYNFNSRDFCKYIDPGTDWIGLSHFNAKGADRFTAEMIKIIPFSVNYQLDYNSPQKEEDYY